MRFTCSLAAAFLVFASTSVALAQSDCSKIVPPSPWGPNDQTGATRSEEHTSELQSLRHLVCRLLLEKKNTDLLFRLYDPVQGAMPIDVQDLRTLRQSSYPRLFGVVSREALLFNATIRAYSAYELYGL